jgi:hypothetical protein
MTLCPSYTLDDLVTRREMLQVVGAERKLFLVLT